MELFYVQIYTLSGHFSVITGSKKESKFLAELLFKTKSVYKVKVFSTPKGKLPAPLDLSGGKLIFELI